MAHIALPLPRVPAPGGRAAGPARHAVLQHGQGVQEPRPVQAALREQQVSLLGVSVGGLVCGKRWIRPQVGCQLCWGVPRLMEPFLKDSACCCGTFMNSRGSLRTWGCRLNVFSSCCHAPSHASFLATNSLLPAHMPCSQQPLVNQCEACGRVVSLPKGQSAAAAAAAGQGQATA